MAVAKKEGVVKIGNKEYHTVAKRVNDFRKDKKYEGYCLVTSVQVMDELKVIVLCEIRDPADRIVATGHAEEWRASSKINRTSALENCETSAIGRALASLGIGGTEFASANEVAGAIHQQAPITEVQAAAINALISAGTISDGHLLAAFGHANVHQLLTSEADRILNAVNAAQHGQQKPVPQEK